MNLDSRLAGADRSAPGPVRWALVTGTRGTDRSGLTLGVLDALRRRGVAVGGFRQEVIDGEGGERAGYSLRHLTDGELVTVATRGGPGCECGDRVCDYTFDPDILARIEGDHRRGPRVERPRVIEP